MGKLPEQVTPNVANSDYEKIEHLSVREKKTVVDYAESFLLVLEVYDYRDVGLRGTLGTGNHVDAVAAECVEELAGYA